MRSHHVGALEKVVSLRAEVQAAHVLAGLLGDATADARPASAAGRPWRYRRLHTR